MQMTQPTVTILARLPPRQGRGPALVLYCTRGWPGTYLVGTLEDGPPRRLRALEGGAYPSYAAAYTRLRQAAAGMETLTQP